MIRVTCPRRHSGNPVKAMPKYIVADSPSIHTDGPPREDSIIGQ